MAERKIFRKTCRHWLMLGSLLACCAVGSTSCTDGYDLDEREPDWPGADVSIYGYLQGQGNYTNMVRLIDDLDYRSVLDKTGSKTLFAADDDAFKRFFTKNDWGVGSYDMLTPAQKRLLLFGAMIDNSYQVQALSSTEGPKEGDCMRRKSSLDIYDNVSVMLKKDIPDGIYWQMYKDRDTLVVMHDMTPRPMIHFIERFMANKQITNEDYDFLFNNTTQRKNGDASVNSAQILEQNIRCLNGFVNRMSEVVTPLPNMADIIATNPQTTVFAQLLERYAVLDECGDEVTRSYNANNELKTDSVFQLRYFSKRSQGGAKFSSSHNQKSEANCELPYDPGWNSYYITSNATAETAMQQDMAVMLVPTDEAINDYWNNGAGAALKKSFGSWQNVPYSTLTELMKANMIESLVSSVPSKFQSMLNDAADPMGITIDDVKEVLLGCNGAIYLTKRVFTPTSFVSVMYPTVVDQDMSIMHWAIEQLNYNAYLNSLNSRYSFFLPSNGALLEYVDPCSYGKPQRQMLRFHYDPDRKGNEVYASIHNIDGETGVVGDSIGVLTNSGGKSLDNNPILNRLYNILDDHVVIGDVEDGHEYYRTKGGSTLRVRNVAQGASGMLVEGSRQVNGETPSVPVDNIYDQTNGGNGKTYILEQGPVLGTRQTVFKILGQHPEFSRFRELLQGSDLLETIHDGRFACSDTCISTFNNFHYTVYVPTNESIDALIADKKLPTWDEVSVLDTTDIKQKEQYHEMTDKINRFLRYHIQDNAIFIGADNTTGNDEFDDAGMFKVEYETAFIDYIDQAKKKDKTFQKLAVKTDKQGSKILVLDKAGNERHVMTEKPGLFNLMAREYTYNSSDKTKANAIHNSSSVVVHLINGPLLIEN